MDVVAGKKTIYKSITLTDPTVAVAGNNAIARHTMAVETETDGKPGSAKVGVLQVWAEGRRKRKLLARQAFRVRSRRRKARHHDIEAGAELPPDPETRRPWRFLINLGGARATVPERARYRDRWRQPPDG